ncbi:MAG: hypothetical protein M3041_09355 [Acidobacteriota bacterium]|nr:hypothetical protein [Acidobacteriota bacterium]
MGFEQDLRLDPTNSNRIYTSVPGALSSDTSWIWHSEDGGRTFKWVTAGTAKEGKPTTCGGGGDTELAVDSAGNLYFNDLTLANFSTARSGNHGVSFTNGAGADCSNIAVPDVAVDRQWYAVDGDPTNGGNIYLVNDEIGPGAPMCPVSGAGNNALVMYRSPVVAGSSTAGVQFGPGNKVSALLSCFEGIMGNNEVSPVATRTGQIVGGQPTTLFAPVKHIYVIHDDATLSKILIGRCFPVAFGLPVPNVSDPSGLNCVDLPVADLGTPDTVRTGGNFPTMTIDMNGNLYAVWEQAPVDAAGKIGNTSLKYSWSTDEGNHWSTPVTIPTPGLLNNVFAWPASGDDGRVDIAFYGTSAAVNSSSGCATGGPDSVDGTWSLYMVQTLNGHAASPTFTAPILASEHYIHKGSIQTVLGGQCGDRTLGDFLQVRVGSRGEAHIAYADSNNANESSAPHGMYVKQNGGIGLFVRSSPVGGDPIMLNAAGDPSGDAKRETDTLTSANIPNLDILQSSFSQPAPADCHPAGTPCYRVKMTVNNLSLTPPAPDLFAVWLTQWLVPAATGCTSTVPAGDCRNGGKNPFVYFKSDGTCWSGQNAVTRNGGGVTLTYPGEKQITATGACSFTLGSFGTISIDVPIADVSLASGTAPLSNRLFSVTASTMTLVDPPETPVLSGTLIVPGATTVTVRRLGGSHFDLIDVVRAYDFVPGAGGGSGGCRGSDGDGDVAGNNGGKAHFHFHHDECGQKPESEDFTDSGSGTDFHSTQVTSVAYDDVAHTITLAGVGTNNGVPVAFTIVGVDSALLPPGTFTITLSDGYTNAGTLLTGSITIR